MIPASKKAFLVTNLVPGTHYDLCVLATWDDTATTLTGTSVLGCTHFFTHDDFPQCQTLPSQLLGGTMILAVGGLIVATLLVFIVILMVRYKAAPMGKLISVSDTYAQTNGGRLGQNGLLMLRPQPPPEPDIKAEVARQNEVVDFRCGSLQGSLTSSSSSSGSMAEGSYSLSGTLPNILMSALPKPRCRVDNLLGAFNSLELQCHETGASGSAMMTKAHTDKEPLLGRMLDSSLSRLLMLPLDFKPKRSTSFDMGDVTGTGASQLCSKPHRISSVWTRRSLSVNGMLQCEGEGDTGGSKATVDSTDWVMESTV